MRIFDMASTIVQIILFFIFVNVGYYSSAWLLYTLCSTGYFYVDLFGFIVGSGIFLLFVYIVARTIHA